MWITYSPTIISQETNSYIEAPKGEIKQIEDVEYKCFALNEWKVMAHLIVDYRYLYWQAINYRATEALYEREIAVYEQRIANLNSAIELSEQRIEWLKKALEIEHKNYLALDRENKWKIWVPIVLLIAENIAIGIINVAEAKQ
jgi:hypothetical protein